MIANHRLSNFQLSFKLYNANATLENFKIFGNNPTLNDDLVMQKNINLTCSA